MTSGRSIRVRLTLSFAAVALVAMGVMAAASWWLLRQSAFRTADRRLDAQFAAVSTFLNHLEPDLTLADLREEFRESADLASGEALIEVRDASGALLCAPTVAGWAGLEPTLARAAVAPQYERARLDGRPYRAATRVVEGRGTTFRVLAAVPMGAAFEALEHAGVLLVLLLPVAIVAAGVAGYVVSRRALAPVDRMTRAAQAITLRDLDRRLEVPAADDELRRLAVTFNDVLARLEAGVREMARFTADASHELRTPVTLIRTSAELALRRDRTAAEFRQALAEIETHAEAMTGLVDDLLALARSDAGVDAVPLERLDLRAVVRGGCELARPLAVARGVRLECATPEAAVEVAGDTRALGRLVAVLLENGIKYTPSGGVVTARLVAGGASGEAALEVEDTGIGIDPQERPHLFRRFYRGVRARERDAEGSGLGLAIAQAIAVRHGGRIEVDPSDDSRAEVSGCRVRVTLPVTRPTPVDPSARELRAVTARG